MTGSGSAAEPGTAALDDFGQRLRAMRQQVGMTQSDLAGDELSTSYVSLLESGKRRPTPETVTRLAARLDVPVELLRGGTTPDVSGQWELCEAHLNLLSGDVAAAERGYRALWQDSGPGTPLLREALLGQGWCAERRGDLAGAAEQYAQWLGSADEAHDDVEMRINTVARLCRCQQELGRPAQARSVAERTLAELRDLGLERTVPGALLTSLLAELYQDEPQVADRLLATLPDRAELTDPAAQRDLYRRGSHAARDQGRPALALGLARRALATHRFGLQAALGRWLAATRATPGEAALPELARSQPAVADLAGPGDAGRTALLLAERQLAAGHAEPAAGSARAARDLLAGYPLSQARATVLLAQALRLLRQRPSTAEAYRDAIDRYAGLGLAADAARVSLELAAALEQDDDTAGALDAYRRAAQLLGVVHGGVPADRGEPGDPAVPGAGASRG
jgi:transcriptional regulator with XRE-family HTH domain